MSDQVRVNGNVFSFASVECRIDGEPYTGFTAINYEDSRERAYQWGMGRHQAPRGRTSGKYTPGTVTLKGPKDSVRALRAALAAKATDQRSFGNVTFPIVVQYVEPDETPITDVLEDCVWVKSSASNEEGPDALVEEVELSCMRIRWNDLTLYDGTAGAP